MHWNRLRCSSVYVRGCSRVWWYIFYLLPLYIIRINMCTIFQSIDYWIKKIKYYVTISNTFDNNKVKVDLTRTCSFVTPTNKRHRKLSVMTDPEVGARCQDTPSFLWINWASDVFVHCVACRWDIQWRLQRVVTHFVRAVCKNFSGKTRQSYIDFVCFWNSTYAYKLK